MGRTASINTKNNKKSLNNKGELQQEFENIKVVCF